VRFRNFVLGIVCGCLGIGGLFGYLELFCCVIIWVGIVSRGFIVCVTV